MDIYDMPVVEFLQASLLVIILVIVAVAAGGIALLVLAAQSVRELNIPEDADFFETMQAVPITIPIALDLLDLALDVFAAPISWFLLDMIGLGALKMVTVVEGLIPFTGPIPTMTIAWIGARYLVKDKDTSARRTLRQQQLQAQDRYPRIDRSGRSSRADYYRNLALPPGAEAGSPGGSPVVRGRTVRRGTRRMPGGISSDDDLIEGEILDGPGGGDPGYATRRRRGDYDAGDYAASEDWDDEEEF